MCNEDSSGSDSCTVGTNADSFYVQVYAHSALTTVTLIIRGNVFDVSEFQEPGTKIISKLIYIKYNKVLDDLNLPFLEIAHVNAKDEKDYKVSCNGSCGRIKIHVSAYSGDPDIKAG